MLTRMLVPKPKNAFQSPGTHHRGPPPFTIAESIAELPAMSLSLVRSAFLRACF